jgi:hypothetical protein
MGYAIAAYVVVLGALLGYGLRLQTLRRALARREARGHGGRPPAVAQRERPSAGGPEG